MKNELEGWWKNFRIQNLNNINSLITTEESIKELVMSVKLEEHKKKAKQVELLKERISPYLRQKGETKAEELIDEIFEVKK